LGVTRIKGKNAERLQKIQSGAAALRTNHGIRFTTAQFAGKFMEDINMDNQPDQADESRRLFPPTRWTSIFPSGTAGGANLAAVYEAYREPLLLYLLCLRNKPEDASDLVQGFFAELLRRDGLTGVSPKMGRFRTFLITSLKHYLSDQRDRATAIKRGGGQPLLSIEELLAQQGIDRALVDRKGPDWAYDRAWANTVMHEASKQLEWEMTEAGKRALFTALTPIMYRDSNAASYKEIAAELSMSEVAVKVAAKRLRDRLRDLIRQQIRTTVTNSTEVDAELQYLIELLAEA
jgi:RNA polymerase sigma-70 factor (ECF subfamily)